MKPLPLRWKISAWSAAVTGGVVLVFAIGTLISIYNEQIETADMEIREDAMEIKTLLAAGRTLADLVDEPATMAFAIVNRDGIISQSSSNFPAPMVAALSDPSEGQTWNQDGASWHVAAFEWQSDRLWVARNLAEARESIIELLGAYLFALPLATALAAWGGWFVANRALIPVRRAARAAEQIGAEALARRLPETGVQDEIGQLTAVLNQMLDRIERSFRQAERFSADASHELRTPLTIMRGEIDTLLRQPLLPPDTETRLVSLREEIDRLDRITEHLLLLAQFDTGRVTLATQLLDFSALVGEACEDIELLTSAAQLSFVWSVAPELQLQGEPLLLRRMVLNLLDNAAKHNQPDGWIRCELHKADNRIELTVNNSGPGIPAADRDLIFERFHRVASNGTQKGQGLGLSLCREIARIHRGSLTLAPDSGDGITRFTASFVKGSALPILP